MNNGAVGRGLKTLCGESVKLVRREIDFHKVIPRTSILFLTYRCNSRCKTCTMWQRPHEIEIDKELDLKAWKTIIDRLSEAGVTSAEPFGGNVLLRKELLIGVLHHLHKRGMEVHLPTNQIGLDDEITEAIVKYADKVYLSIDEPGDGQDSIRGVSGTAGRAEKAIDILLRLRAVNGGRGNTPKVVCNCTVSRFNASVLEAMVQYAVDMRFDEIHFEYAGEFEKEDVEASGILGIIPDAQYIRQGDSILACRKEVEQIRKSMSLIRKWHKNSDVSIQTVNIDCLSLDNLVEGTIPHKKCYVERTEVTVDPYGNIVICPFITNYPLGNLVEEPFNNIWNNEKHRYFRKAQNGGRLPMCRKCILGVQRNPDLFKSMQRVYLARIKPKLSIY